MVDRCVCYDKRFSEMKAVIGENCGLCIPYVQMIFKTGKTTFDVIPMMGGNTEGI
jgi:hypothetical protein